MCTKTVLTERATPSSIKRLKYVCVSEMRLLSYIIMRLKRMFYFRAHLLTECGVEDEEIYA